MRHIIVIMQTFCLTKDSLGPVWFMCSISRAECEACDFVLYKLVALIQVCSYLMLVVTQHLSCGLWGAMTSAPRICSDRLTS